MEIDVITQVISTVGFPIACCIALFWNSRQADQRHDEEVKTLSKAIENNTLAIQKLIDRLGGDS